MSQPATTWKLRDLPLAVKLVLSVFLITVGLGYFSAMVQLHMQHSLRNGEPMPGPDDLIAKFAGKQKVPEGGLPKQVSKLEFLIMGKTDGELTKETMAPAFFGKSGGDYTKVVKQVAMTGDKAPLEALNAERESERLALREWLNAAPDARKKAYEADAFKISDELATKPMADDFKGADKTVKVKTLFDERCVRCHGGDKKPDLDTYAKMEKFMDVPKGEEVLPGGYIRSPRQMSIEGLTQSTHAHLLSFAVLFTLTGTIFAFSSYHGVFRCTLGPVVLIAQVADIACWWLARLDTMGPMFAVCIMATGAIVGMGLSLQIVLSLFNMYGVKGKGVLVLVFIAGMIGFSVLYFKAIKPGLDSERGVAVEATDKK